MGVGESDAKKIEKSANREEIYGEDIQEKAGMHERRQRMTIEYRSRSRRWRKRSHD